jgi:DNA-binding CsgD family transcriptional regulator
MQKLAPALRSAVALNQALRSKRSLSAALDVVLDTLDSPAFVADARGRLRHANAPALAAAEAGRLIRIGGGGVSFRCRKAQARFGEALAGLSSPGGGAGGSAPVGSEDGAVVALASFHSVRNGALGQAALGWLTQPENWLLVILREFAAESGAVPLDALRMAFGLTQAEARLAAGLAGGAALDEVAAQIGISKETARSQLKAIFAKTGAHRQPELVALLARLARRP